MYEEVTDPSQDGLVLSQDPSGGAVEKGTTVTLVVGQLVSAPTESFHTRDTTTTVTGTSPQTPP